MNTIRATVRGGRLELDQPIDLPEGTELLIPLPDVSEQGAPMSPDEIARVLAVVDRMIPFELTPESRRVGTAHRII